MKLPWKNIVYHALAFMMSCIVLFNTIVLSMGKLLGTIYWWERAIELPFFSALALTTMIQAYRNIIREARRANKQTR